MKPIVVVGSINMDLVVRTSRIPRPGATVHGSSFRTFPGGKGANQAIAIARLGHPVTLIGKVGTDRFGEDLLANLASAGVACNAITRGTGSSGIASIMTDESGENSIVVVGGANQELRPEDMLQYSSLIQSAGMVLLQLEIPLDTVEATARLTHDCGVPVMLDPAPAMLLSSALMKMVTWLTPNETEIGAVLGTALEISGESDARELAEQALATGVKNVIIKLGGRGSYLATGEGLRAAIPAFPVKVYDTTAAGDAYNAGFAVALLEGMPPEHAARYASATAAISVMREGAQTSMATREEVREFLETRTLCAGSTYAPSRFDV